MKILITGHAGFIGQHLTKALQIEEHAVFGWDEIYANDVRNRFKLHKLFSQHKFDYVIHLAARSGVRDSKSFPDEYISTNISGTQNIIELCEKFDYPLIYFSSSSVLGGGDNLKEDAPLNPKSIYAITKAAGENIFNASKVRGFIVRPFTVYGTAGRRDMVIYRWIEAIKDGQPIPFYGDGKTSRGYTYIDDLVDAVIELMKLNVEDKTTINLGGSEVITLNELLGIFKKYKKDIKVDKIPRVMEDVACSSADISKAKELIKYAPKKQFKEIVTNILKTEQRLYK